MSRWPYAISGVKVAPVSELITAIVTLLKADLDLVLELGGRNVYSHETPEDKPPSGKWIVVRELVQNGPVPETLSGEVRPRIQVMAEVVKEHSREDLEDIHDDVDRILVNATLSLTNSRKMGELRRTMRPVPAFDADDDSYYSTAEFQVGLIPVYT